MDLAAVGLATVRKSFRRSLVGLRRGLVRLTAVSLNVRCGSNLI